MQQVEGVGRSPVVITDTSRALGPLALEERRLDQTIAVIELESGAAVAGCQVVGRRT